MFANFIIYYETACEMQCIINLVDMVIIEVMSPKSTLKNIAIMLELPFINMTETLIN